MVGFFFACCMRFWSCSLGFERVNITLATLLATLLATSPDPLSIVSSVRALTVNLIADLP